VDKGSLASEDRLMERNSLELKVLSSLGLVGASEGGGAGTDTNHSRHMSAEDTPSRGD